MERITRTSSLVFTQISLRWAFLVRVRVKNTAYTTKSRVTIRAESPQVQLISATYRLERSGDDRAPAMLTVTADSGILHTF